MFLKKRLLICDLSSLINLFFFSLCDIFSNILTLISLLLIILSAFRECFQIFIFGSSNLSQKNVFELLLFIFLPERSAGCLSLLHVQPLV